MLTVFIGIVLAAVLMYFLMYRTNLNAAAVLLIPTLIVVVSSFIGVAIPGEDYHKPIESTNNLALLSKTEDQNYYLIVSNENEYIYKKTDNNSEIIDVISRDETTSVKVIEDENCTIPVLEKYEYKVKNTFLSFKIITARNKVEYVFIVPKGTVIQ